MHTQTHTQTHVCMHAHTQHNTKYLFINIILYWYIHYICNQSYSKFLAPIQYDIVHVNIFVYNLVMDVIAATFRFL